MLYYGILMLVPLVAGLAVGLTLADVDTVFTFLTHRSLVTHSFLLPLGAFFVFKSLKEPQDWVRIVVVGLCIGMAIHLSFDVFPVGWRGRALIHVPVYGYLNAAMSVVWMSVSIIVCLYIALHNLHEAVEVAVSTIALCLAFGFASRFEQFFWQSLAVLVAGLVVALFLPESHEAAVQKLRKHVGKGKIA